MNNNIKVKGLVTTTVLDENGNIKSQSQHNQITTTGFGLLTDLLSNVPAKQKFDTSHSYITVGTGYSATAMASQQFTHTSVGVVVAQAGYPSSGTFPSNTVTWSFLFSAGSLNANNINEACLVNNPISGSGQSLAYAQINPAVSVLSTDTLNVTWTLTFS
jgi:hypothetical protein